MLSLWNPPWTTYRDTRVHRPNWARHGGQMLRVAFEALQVDTTKAETVPLRLESEPERRFIDGRAVTMAELDRGFMHSPFVTWAWHPRRLTVERPGYGGVTYHVDEARLDE